MERKHTRKTSKRIISNHNNGNKRKVGFYTGAVVHSDRREGEHSRTKNWGKNKNLKSHHSLPLSFRGWDAKPYREQLTLNLKKVKQTLALIELIEQKNDPLDYVSKEPARYRRELEIHSKSCSAINPPHKLRE